MESAFMPPFPIIRFELEGIKRSMLIALTQHQALMDADLKAAVEAYCTPENISKVIHEAAYSALNYAIKEEVNAFFRHGEGRKVVAAAVKEAILKNETYTPLDDIDDKLKESGTKLFNLLAKNVEDE